MAKFALTSMAAVIALLVCGGCGGSTSETVRAGDPPITAPLSVASTVPAGDVQVNYGNASIVVPSTWSTLQPGETQCGPGATENLVLLGNAAVGGSDCPDTAAPSSFAHLSTAPTNLPSGTRMTVNGQTAIALASGTDPTYAFPGMGVELQVGGPQGPAILQSIGWSTRHLVLEDLASAVVPHDWGFAVYQGVKLRLPRSWPLAVVGPGQGEPGAAFPTPTLWEGTPFGIVGGLSIGLMTPGDGVWLQGSTTFTAAQAIAHGYQPLPVTGARVLTDESNDPMGLDPVLNLVVVGRSGVLESIEVGLGANPTVAADIIASITTTTAGNATTNKKEPASPDQASTTLIPSGPVETTTSSAPSATTGPVPGPLSTTTDS